MLVIIAIILLMTDFNIIETSTIARALPELALLIGVAPLAYLGLRKLPRKSEPRAEGECLAYKIRASDPSASEKLNALIIERSRRSKASYSLLLSYKTGDAGALLLICGRGRDVLLESEIFESIIASTITNIRATRVGSPLPGTYDLIQRLSSLTDSGSRLRLPAHPTPQRTASRGVVRIGSRIDTPLPIPVYLDWEDIEGHIGVFGSTGSGKSTTLRKIAGDLARHGLQVIVLDWTGEHAGYLSKLGWPIIDPRREGLPFEPLLESPISRQVLVDILSSALGLSEPQAFLLSRVIEEHRPGNIIELVDYIAEWPEQSNWDREVKRALYRKIESLKYFNNKYNGLRRGSAVVDLSLIPSPRLRRAYALIFITNIYYQARRGGSTATLVAVEEAHNLFLGESGVMEEILSESRKYNLYIVYVTQSPSVIPGRIFLNTNTKIVHALRSQRDKQVIQQAMSLGEEKLALIDKLGRGEALVQSPTMPEPVLVKVDPGL